MADRRTFRLSVYLDPRVPGEAAAIAALQEMTADLPTRARNDLIRSILIEGIVGLARADGPTRGRGVEGPAAQKPVDVKARPARPVKALASKADRDMPPVQARTDSGHAEAERMAGVRESETPAGDRSTPQTAPLMW